jgi:hypothetical protein
MNPSRGFHDIQSREFHGLHVNNHGLEDQQQQQVVEDGRSSLCLKDLSRAFNVPNEKLKVPVKKPGKLFYGTKKTRDTRKAKKRCVEGCDMYIVRVKKDTEDWAMSKPCRECWEVMHTLGIRKVYYTTANGTWTCEKVASMETTHRSSGVLALQAYREEAGEDKKRK